MEQASILMTPPSSILNSVGAQHSLICWKAVASGVFVGLLAYMILSALGAGIGGFTVAHIIAKNENGTGLAAGAGLWLGLTSVISLFLGSYFATRYSLTEHKQTGAAQGILIAAIFFIFIMQGAGGVIGNLSAFTMNLAGTGAASASDAEEAARLVGDTGWILFVSFSLGLGGAILGGIEGALGNKKRPFTGLTVVRGG